MTPETVDEDNVTPETAKDDDWRPEAVDVDNVTPETVDDNDVRS